MKGTITESVFTKVFSYRQRENHSPLENFLTEIFSFCIKDDDKFREDFFFTKVLKVKHDNTDFNISTQAIYPNYGRPDIEVTYNNTAILFECKVEASERKNQLEDYASILTEEKTKFSDKHIVFLTKYFEQKDITDSRVKLHLIRWREVYELINDNHNQITQQLKLFLKEKDMENVKNFNIQDLLAMKTIITTQTKMDELLEQLKPEVWKKLGGYKNSPRSSQLQYDIYIDRFALKFNEKQYLLFVGFFWWDKDDIKDPSIGLSFQISHEQFENSSLIKILKKELENKNHWKFNNTDTTDIYISTYKPITDFIAGKDDNIPAMRRFIQEKLNTLYDIKGKYPDLFLN